MQRAADVTTELHSAVQQQCAFVCLCVSVSASSSLIQLALSDLGQNRTIELKLYQHTQTVLYIFVLEGKKNPTVCCPIFLRFNQNMSSSDFCPPMLLQVIAEAVRHTYKQI